MCLRQVTRAYALYSVYGMRSVFFGCLLPPLFPVRLVYGNIINFFAVIGAMKMKLGIESQKKKQLQQEELQKDMEEYMFKAFSFAGIKRDVLESLTLYHEGKINYEQAVLIGKYALLTSASESQMRKDMGILD